MHPWSTITLYERGKKFTTRGGQQSTSSVTHGSKEDRLGLLVGARFVKAYESGRGGSLGTLM